MHIFVNSGGGNELRKIGFAVILIIFLLMIIPIFILDGVGNGIDIPKMLSEIPKSISKANNNSSDNIKVKVFYVVENKVVEISLEDYVVGVVASEMPAAFSEEALKAQAVAARTFVLSKTKEFGGSGCPKHPDAGQHDVCSDVHCQRYVSKDEQFKEWNSKSSTEYWNKITKAVQETKGMVLTYNGELIKDIKYHAASGGKTESSKEVFGYSEPYLVSVEGPSEDETPYFEKQVKKSNSEFIKIIKELDKQKLKKGEPAIKFTNAALASQIKVLERTEGDRVKTIKIADKKFTGVELRVAFELKSADFKISVNNKEVIFTVNGYGHGVGMSQWGANEMAKSGKKYDEILKHYYVGINISDRSQLLKTR